MKKLLSILLFLPLMSFAQEAPKEKELSKADLFSAKSGTLIQKEFIEIGKVKDLEIKVLLLKDLINSAKTSSVRFETETGSGYSLSTKIGGVDGDELDGLIKSIKLLQGNILSSTPVNYTEVSFRSRDGFEAGCFYDEVKKKWSAYLKLVRFDSKSMVFLTTEELSQILTLLEQAKGKLV